MGAEWPGCDVEDEKEVVLNKLEDEEEALNEVEEEGSDSDSLTELVVLFCTVMTSPLVPAALGSRSAPLGYKSSSSIFFLFLILTAVALLPSSIFSSILFSSDFSAFSSRPLFATFTESSIAVGVGTSSSVPLLVAEVLPLFSEALVDPLGLPLGFEVTFSSTPSSAHKAASASLSRHSTPLLSEFLWNVCH